MHSIVSGRQRLIRPIDGASLPMLLEKLIQKFVPDFALRQTVSEPTLVTYESNRVSIRRERQEHSYEDSYENWWPTEHWWECHVTGIPGVAKFSLVAGTSSPGAEEVYNFLEFAADEAAWQKLETEWRGLQLNRAIYERAVVHSLLIPQEWQDFFLKSRNLVFTGSFDWLRQYRLAQGEDVAPLVFECDGKNWLATSGADFIVTRGPIPADGQTVKETRERSTTGAEPTGLELAQKILPHESGWRELFPETTDACFLGTAWGAEISTRAWHNERWLMRQSIGGNKWGGMRAVYWLQPIALSDAHRFAMLALFEIYGGGARMSFDPKESNTQYFYTVVGGIDPAEKAAFLKKLDTVLTSDGWEKE